MKSKQSGGQYRPKRRQSSVQFSRRQAFVAAAHLSPTYGALVANETTWILDVKVSNNGEGVELPNGPFPAHAFVPNGAEHQGEVIIWIADGHLSGLEYAWVNDDPPTRWPRADEMEVVLRASP